MIQAFGKTLLIANPAAQNGNGASAALFAGDKLRSRLSSDNFSLIMTEAKHHGWDIASRSQEYDTVIALGGDGLIHEVANGLMALSESDRPQLAVLPVGSGNDYASTLKMSFKIEESIEQLLATQPKAFDLGCCNGEYFVETLSFGLDAAIALDTVKRRQETGKTGTALFLESGIDMLLHHLREYEYTLSGTKASLSDEKVSPEKGRMILFAVQVGPTYGGGFTICPDARTDDGLLDLCIAHPPLSVVKAVFIFLLAKNAHHTGFKQLEFLKTDSLTLSFDGFDPPVQIDGEPFGAEIFSISCVPHALQVLVPN